MAEEAQLLADAAKLPIDERCSHANWKVRSAAYEQIKASCNSVFDSSDPVLSEYGKFHCRIEAVGSPSRPTVLCEVCCCSWCLPQGMRGR